MRRLLRWVFRLAGGLIAFGLLAAGALLVVLHTDWGREKVRAIAEAQLDDLVEGDVTLGRLTGSVLGRFEIQGVSVADRDGHPALRARKLLVDYDLLSLLRRRVRIDELEVIEPIVTGHLDGEGALNLLSLWKRQPIDPRASPTRGEPWAVQLGVLRIRDGLVVIPMGTATHSLAHVDLDARVDVAATTRRFEVARLSLIWIERGVHVEAHGSVVHGDPLIALAGVEIVAGGSRLGVPLGLVRPPAGGVVAAVDVLAHEADLFPFWPHGTLLGDVAAHGVVVRVNDGAPIETRLQIEALGGELALAAAVFPESFTVRGELRARGLRSPLAAVPAAVDAEASFEVTGRSLPTLRGRLELAARGTLLGHQVDGLKLNGTVEGRTVRADVTAALPEARGTAHVELRLADDPALITLDAGRLRADVSDLRRLTGRPDLDGDLRVDLSARGTLRALAIAGTAQAAQLRSGSMQAKGVSAIFDVTDISGVSAAAADPRGFVNLDAGQVVTGTTSLGRVHLRARLPGGRVAEVALAVIGPDLPYTGRAAARVALRGAGVEVSIRRIELLARGLELGGSGGVVTLDADGRLSARDVALSSPAGTLEIEGALASSRLRALPEGKLHIHARGLDLALLRNAFAPGAQPVSGTVTADLHLARDRGRLAFDGELLASGMVTGYPGVPAVDLTARVRVGNGELVASGHVRDAASVRPVGIVDFALSSRAPLDLADAAAWRRIDLDDGASSLLLIARDVDLAALGDLMGLRDLAGRIDGSLVAAPGTRSLVLSATVRGFTIPRARGLDARLDGRWEHDGLTLAAAVSARGVEIVHGAATVRVGLPALLRGARLADQPLTATLAAAGVPIEGLRGVFPGMGRRAQGKLSIDGKLQGTLARPTGTLAVRLDQARLARVAFHDLEARLRLEAGSIDADVAAHQDAGGSLDAAVSVSRLPGNALSGRLQASRFDLGFLAAMAGRQNDLLAGIGGKLDADLQVAAQAGERSASGTLALHDGQIYSPGGLSGLVHGIELGGRISPGRVTIETLTGTSGSGSFRGSAEIALGEGLAPRELTGRISATRFPVSAGAMIVALSFDAEVSCRRARDVWEIEASAQGTRIRVPEERRTGEKVQPVGALPDVVFTDLPDFQRRTALLALTGSAEVDEDGGPVIRLRLKTPGGVRVSGRELDLLLATNLTVLYRGGNPHVGGAVEANRGFIELFNRRYEVLRANASFDESDRVNPHLDIRLSHEFRATTIYIHVGGTSERPTLDLSADPGSYDQAQLLGWVLGGDPDDPAIGKRPIGTEAVGLASNMVLGQMQDLVKLALPIDVLSVKMGEGSNPQTTRFEVGKWMTENLFVGYAYRLNAPEDENVNEAQVSYRIGARWLLDAFFGDHGVAGADLIWSRKY